jgi:transcriptional regulator with XRE-family HTH domain
VTTSAELIRSLRARRGWTQLEVAQNLDRLAWTQTGKHVGVNADMVAKWERGVKAPSRRYQELLDSLSDVECHDTTTVIGVGCQTDGRDADPIGVLLAQTGLLLDGLGRDALILRPRVLEVWEAETLRRRSLLKLVTLAPALAMVGQQDRGRRPGVETAASLANLADGYQRLYHVTAPTLLITPVVAHLDVTRELLREANSACLRRSLLRNQAQVALLAGRISFFDLNDAIAARGYYGLAFESSVESGAHHLATSALGHTAFISAADGRVGTAIQYLEQATAVLDRDPHHRLSSWLAAVGSEITANAGAATDSLGYIDRARTSLAQPGLAPDLPWFDFFDESRLAGFAGYASLRARRYDDALTLLSSTLHRLPEDAVKQRAVALADLAAAHLAQGDLARSCAIASDAVDRLRQAGYATGLERLRSLRSSMTPWAASASVRNLDQHLALAA